ncbi:RNA polymerase sigma factor [Niabella beijingensis]|uniref:RNA polymerase sigma factor n=1 Tax=Niabella beijingensis TaxID=2872700 RepID=UPI001CC19833|nr:sigma-70 family RNA polymerase sigma factor [Niabella beijingensis]MBZ4189380.1 sigma-70 family RNA polymerase sigma factor [Niabella beijingensis]
MEDAEETITFNYIQRSKEDVSAFWVSESGFNRAVKHFSPVLYNKVLNITRQHQAAEDVVQETFLRLWEKRNEVVPDNIGGWLYKVAVNLACQYVKRENSKNRIYHLIKSTDQEYGTSGEEQLLKKENAQLIHKIYMRLPEKQKTVYHLSRKEGMSRNEIAEQLNISPHTVKNHLANAIQFIKEQVTGLVLLLVFFVFNNLFFNNGSTKAFLDDLYRIEHSTKKGPDVLLIQHYLKNRSVSFQYFLPSERLKPL